MVRVPWYGKSVLGRIRNCVGLCCEMVASFYECQPNHSYVDFMFRLHSDLTRGVVVAGVLYRADRPREYPTVLS